MYCTNCGQSVPKGASFCTECAGIIQQPPVDSGLSKTDEGAHPQPNQPAKDPKIVKAIPHELQSGFEELANSMWKIILWLIIVCPGMFGTIFIALEFGNSSNLFWFVGTFIILPATIYFASYVAIPYMEKCSPLVQKLENLLHGFLDCGESCSF